MFDWLGDIFSGIGNAIGDTIEYLGTQIRCGQEVPHRYRFG